MNICIIGQYPPQVGGIATYTKQLEEIITKNGDNVFIITYKSDCDRKNNVFEAKTIDIPIIRGLSFIVSSIFILKKICKKYDIDIIHANYIIPAGLIPVLLKNDAIKVLTVHGSDINILADNKIIRPIIKYILNKTDHLYFVSKELKEKAEKLNINNMENKSIITPNTVNINKFKPTTNQKILEKYKKPIVMFIGNLVEQKGLIYLLKSKKISTAEYTLLIYGDGPQKDKLNKYIQENDLKETYLMGKTIHPEKLIPEADIMVLPSISEGASIIALESMSCQKALISTDTGNIRDVITNYENGIIVPPKDYEKLNEAIEYLITNPDKREHIAQNARKLIVEKYAQTKIPYLEKR